MIDVIFAHLINFSNSKHLTNMIKTLFLSSVQMYSFKGTNLVLAAMPWLLLLLLSFVTAQDCPCSYDRELSEVSCEPETQSQLPWQLPHCLSQDIYPEVGYPRLEVSSPRLVQFKASNCR